MFLVAAVRRASRSSSSLSPLSSRLFQPSFADAGDTDGNIDDGANADDNIFKTNDGDEDTSIDSNDNSDVGILLLFFRSFTNNDSVRGGDNTDIDDDDFAEGGWSTMRSVSFKLFGNDNDGSRLFYSSLFIVRSSLSVRKFDDDGAD